MAELFDSAALLVPDGLLEVGWFNGKKRAQVLAMLDGFAKSVPAAVAETGDDAVILEATTAWVYSNGYGWIAADLANRLGTIEITNEVSKKTDPEGPAYFAKLADRWLAEFYKVMPEVAPTNKKPATKSYSFTPRW